MMRSLRKVLLMILLAASGGALLAECAADIARKVSGVQSVKNDLEVAP